MFKGFINIGPAFVKGGQGGMGVGRVMVKAKTWKQDDTNSRV